MTLAQLEALEPTLQQVKLLNQLDGETDLSREERLVMIAKVIGTLTYQQIEHMSEIGSLKDLMLDLVDHAEMALEDSSSMGNQANVAFRSRR